MYNSTSSSTPSSYHNPRHHYNVANYPRTRAGAQSGGYGTPQSAQQQQARAAAHLASME